MPEGYNQADRLGLGHSTADGMPSGLILARGMVLGYVPFDRMSLAHVHAGRTPSWCPDDNRGNLSVGCCILASCATRSKGKAAEMAMVVHRAYS
jgi:hypothetical protein